MNANNQPGQARMRSDGLIRYLKAQGPKLPARHVIHTVGPVWSAGKAERNKELLASCYRNSLALAGKRKLRSIAFPAISTGVYGFPADRAAGIAVDVVAAELAVATRSLRRLVFCCFSKTSAQHHVAAFAARGLG